MNEEYQVFGARPERQGGGELSHSRAMYLGYFLALGALLPYINLYYGRMGLSGIQIGTLAALPVLVASLATLLWGGVADRFTWHDGILRMALLVCPISVFTLSKANSFAALIPIVVLYALFNSPILPILDSAALEAARTYRDTYGNLRVWGTIGWSVSTLAVGALIEKFNITWFVYSYIVFILFTFLLSLRQSTRMPPLRFPVRQGLNQLLSPYFFIFLLSIFLLTMTSGAFHAFFSIYLDGINAKESLIGLAWTLASLSEIPIMLRSGYIIEKISAGGLLKISFLAYALRWLLLSLISTPLWALLTQLLHGLSFAAFLVGGVTYIYELAPEGLNTTAQSIFNSVSFGLASIAGSLLGGYFYDALGMPPMFRFISLIAIIAFFVFYLSDKSRAKATGERRA